MTFDGKHYQVTDAFNVPGAVSPIPVMIGGSGEKKTLRMVAQYADESNLAGTPPHYIPRKLDALAAHCEHLGRDRSDITVTAMQMVCVAPTTAEAEADLAAMAATKGWNDAVVEMAKKILASATPTPSASNSRPAWTQASTDSPSICPSTATTPTASASSANSHPRSPPADLHARAAHRRKRTIEDRQMRRAWATARGPTQAL